MLLLSSNTVTGQSFRRSWEGWVFPDSKGDAIYYATGLQWLQDGRLLVDSFGCELVDATDEPSDETLLRPKNELLLVTLKQSASEDTWEVKNWNRKEFGGFWDERKMMQLNTWPVAQVNGLAARLGPSEWKVRRGDSWNVLKNEKFYIDGFWPRLDGDVVFFSGVPRVGKTETLSLLENFLFVAFKTEDGWIYEKLGESWSTQNVVFSPQGGFAMVATPYGNDYTGYHNWSVYDIKRRCFLKPVDNSYMVAIDATDRRVAWSSGENELRIDDLAGMESVKLDEEDLDERD